MASRHARYKNPGDAAGVASFKPRYDHFIGGDYLAPVKGQYFDNPTPITVETFTEGARGTAEDVEAALAIISRLDSSRSNRSNWVTRSTAEPGRSVTSPSRQGFF